MNLLGIFRTAQFKRITIFQPVIRNLKLETILDLLLEHTVTVTDTAAIGTVIQSCKRIQEAGCQTSKTAVSKSRIRLLIFNYIEIKTQFLKSFLYLAIGCQVQKIVAQSAAHKELHGHIVYDLRILFLICILCLKPVVNDNILYCIADCLKNLFLSRLFKGFAIQKFYIFFYAFFKSLFFELLIYHFFFLLLSGVTPRTTFSLLMLHSFT